jgi:hypothetical protein
MMVCCFAGRISANGTKIQDILGCYEMASRKQINRAKTSVFFSRNTKEVDRELIRNAARIKVTNCYEKYLELPALIGRSKISSFNGIEGQIRSKLNGFYERVSAA